VCVVELASVLGGEAFSDRPRCVCRVIGAFLRSWNDRAGYADRQRLLPYASRAVGTGGYRRISRIRRDVCLGYAGADLDRGPLGRAAARLRMRGRIAWSLSLWQALRLKSGAGVYAARVCSARGGSEEAFALLDRLLDVGSQSAPATNGNGNGHRADDLAIRAAIIARERAKSRAARGSGSGSAATADRHPDRRARTPGAGSSR
jgi:hypothetical protein